MLIEVFPERGPAGGGQVQGEDTLGPFTGPLHAALAELFKIHGKLHWPHGFAPTAVSLGYAYMAAPGRVSK